MFPVYVLGRIVAIKIGPVEHFAVTSLQPPYNEPALISLSRRRGAVTEEPWNEVIGTRPWRYATELEGSLAPHQILARARSKVGAHGYSLLERNCEHFVRWAAGLKVESKQVNTAYFVGILCTLAFAFK